MSHVKNITIVISLLLLLNTVYPVIHLTTISASLSNLFVNDGCHWLTGLKPLTLIKINEFVYYTTQNIFPDSQTKGATRSEVERDQRLQLFTLEDATVESKLFLPRVYERSAFRPLEYHSSATRHHNYRPQPGPPLEDIDQYMVYFVLYSLFALLWIFYRACQLTRPRLSEQKEYPEAVTGGKKKKKKKKKKKAKPKHVRDNKDNLATIEPLTDHVQITPSQQTETETKPKAPHVPLQTEPKKVGLDKNESEMKQGNEKWQKVKRKNKNANAVKNKNGTEKKRTKHEQVTGKIRIVYARENNTEMSNFKKHAKSNKREKPKTAHLKISTKPNLTKPEVAPRVLPEEPWDSPWKRVTENIAVLSEIDYPKLV